jgi:hypothetical protein
MEKLRYSKPKLKSMELNFDISVTENGVKNYTNKYKLNIFRFLT